MNLCVETAPNVLTSPWEGGPPGSGPWALAPGLVRGPLLAAVASLRDVKGLATQRAVILLATFQWLCSHRSPSAPLPCPSLVGTSVMGVLGRWFST